VLARDDFYSAQYRHLHTRDLKLMQRAGINTVRLYAWHETLSVVSGVTGKQRNGHLGFLDLCTQHGIYAIVTFEPSFGRLHSARFDIRDRRVSELRVLHARFRRFVRELQQHPAVLAYAIGNEPNAQQHSSHAVLLATFQLSTELRTIRDQECAAQQQRRHCHPLTIPLADVGAPDVLRFLEPYAVLFPRAVDFWSWQLYRGDTFGTFLADFAAWSRAVASTVRLLRSRPPLDFFKLFPSFGSNANAQQQQQQTQQRQPLAPVTDYDVDVIIDRDDVLTAIGAGGGSGAEDPSNYEDDVAQEGGWQYDNSNGSSNAMQQDAPEEEEEEE
jgi:hypothetical protein